MPDIDIPNRVASASFLNQSSTLPPTTLYTPPAAGLFRVSICTTSVAVSPGEAPTVYWKDENRSNSLGLSLVNGAGFGFAEVILRSVANFPIQFGATYGSSPYSAYLVVEQL